MVAHVERSVVLDAPADRVWQALIEDPSGWFDAEVEIEPRPGGRVRVDDRRGTVERFAPGEALSFRVWTPPPVEGSRIDFVLEPLDGEHTVLTVTETQLASAPRTTLLHA
ncbi:MAG TPA: SRPBCC domain-containing protein [Acidimicrobiales bacterium]|nr:SRPBCC domain-containing protein [Acidimicrobiales bacterium]